MTRFMRPVRRGVPRPAWLLVLAGVLLAPAHALAQADSSLALALERHAARSAHRDAERAIPVLQAFYSRREWRPLWTGPSGFNAAGRSLRRALETTAAHGLEPTDFHLRELDSLALLPGAASRADLEVMASVAALRAAHDLGWGVTVPGEVDRENDYAPATFDADSVLAILAGASNPGVRVLEFAPSSGPYRLLTRSLAALRRTREMGGWTATVEPGPTLRPGATGPRVAALRQALAERGDLDRALAPGDSFDAELATALLQFQYRHGLAQDTAFGPRGRAELAVPLDRRIQQVRLGLERMRWLPWDFPGRYIGVNLAAFRAYVFEGDSIVFATNTVIGKQYHETPMFVGTMTYLVINPYWIVPASIARTEILPEVERDSAYLATHHMEIVDGTVRQVPGPWNSLGRFKFMFPNRHDIYLHDTPARALFDEADRAYSHGCVRVQHPAELAHLLLAGQGWSAERIAATVEAGQQVIVTLDEPLPVLISYATAFSDLDGLLHFRRDVYQRDEKLRAALERRGHGTWEN